MGYGSDRSRPTLILYKKTWVGQVACPERRINMLTTENTFTEYPDIVSFKQLMQMLHIGRNKACNLLKTDIPSIRIGSTHKIPKVYVIDYLNRKTVNQ